MHRFSTFAGGMDMFSPGAAANDGEAGAALRTLNGTARFKGPAAGKYVTRNLVANTAEIGSFTATAELLANFGMTAADGSISGAVTKFMENGESLGNWSVSLSIAPLAGVTDAASQFMGATSATVGGSSAIAGRWNGMFYGDERKDGRPNAAAGMFDAIADHVAISGAFGVHNTDQ